MNLQYVSPSEVELKRNPINFVFDTPSLHPHTHQHPLIPPRTLTPASLLGGPLSSSRQTSSPSRSVSLQSVEVENDTPISNVFDSTPIDQTTSIATLSPPSSTSSPAVSLPQALHAERHSTAASTPLFNSLCARENSAAPQHFLGSPSSRRCPSCSQQFLKRHLLK